MAAATVVKEDTVIYNVIKSLVSAFKTEFDPDEIKIRAVSTKYAIDATGYASQPTIVLQGPTIQNNEEGHQSEINYVEILPETDPKTFEKTISQEILDLVFRIRVFAGGQGALARAWLIINKLIRLASKIVLVNSIGEEYNVFIRNKFDPDTIPNKSNLVHYEGEAVIEAVKIDGIPAGITYQLKDLKLESFKKGEST